MADVVRQLARPEIHDVVRARSAVQPSETAHLVGNGVIRACRVTADAEPANHLPALVEWDTTTECDDAAGNPADPGPLFLELRIERIGIVQSIE